MALLKPDETLHSYLRRWQIVARSLKGLAVAILVLAGAVAWGQTVTDQLKYCQGQTADIEIFPPDTCSTVLTYLSPSDVLGYLTADGSFAVLSPSSKYPGKFDVRSFNLPPKLRSSITLASLRRTIDDTQTYAGRVNARGDARNVFKDALLQEQDLWANLRAVYCYYHPDGKYSDLRGSSQPCFEVPTVADEKVIDGWFDSVLVVRVNVDTFATQEFPRK